MTNVALNKHVEEDIGNAGAATDGNTTRYTGNEGYAWFDWPGTLTVDLGGVHVLRCVRTLLWDGLGQGGVTRDPRTYLYRLLASSDHNHWIVIFDTGHTGFNGWQVFNFPHGIQTRYIRIHGLANSANRSFHVVQVEAYDDDPPPLTVEATLQRMIVTNSLQEESGDGLPLQMRVRSVINGIEQLVNTTQYLNPQPFRDLISQLRLQLTDIGSIERSMDSIRREIIGPVKEELNKAGKLGKFSFWGFWVGIIGGLLAIVSLILNIYLAYLTLKPK